MPNLLWITLLLATTMAFAMDASEEAVLLNQEMQFLEEAGRGTLSTAPLETTVTRTRGTVSEDNLESTYFGDDEEDAISTRTAARKRSINEDTE